MQLNEVLQLSTTRLKQLNETADTANVLRTPRIGIGYLCGQPYQLYDLLIGNCRLIKRRFGWLCLAAVVQLY